MTLLPSTVTGGTTITTVTTTSVDVTVGSGGTLTVNNDPASGSANGGGTVIVTGGGTLAGNGSVGNLIVNSGGTVSPGASPGTISVTGNATWGEAGTYAWQVNDATGTAGADPGWDLTAITGTLTISATSGSKFAINASSLTLDGSSPKNFSPGISYAWKIASAAGGVTGFDASKFTINTSGFFFAGGGTFSVVNSGNDINLVFTPRSQSQSDVTASWSVVGTGAERTIHIVLQDPYGLSKVEGLRYVNMAATYTAYGVGDTVLQAATSLVQSTSEVPFLQALPLGTVKVVVIGSKVDPGQPASMNARGYSINQTFSATIDPVNTELVITESGESRQTFEGIPSAEHHVSVRNGAPGLRSLTILVNGQAFAFSNLSDGQAWRLDIGTAMVPGDENVVVLVGEGLAGASAEVAIGDAESKEPLETAAVTGDSLGLRVERTPEGVVVSWSADGMGWVLGASTELGAPGSWQQWPGKPTSEAGRWRVTVPSTAPAQLFRLMKP